MRLPWNKQTATPMTAGPAVARCPDCHCQLSISFEQHIFLAESKPVWIFCPICARIVSGERDRAPQPRR